MAEEFYSIGEVADTLDVRLSYRIIQLFSEGLYSSPNKAVEELVANSFDAGARRVHISVSPDLSDRQASIAVIDDGSGMDVAGLQQHWVVGASNKRDDDTARALGRRPIGKFGIGKLASYVLADRLTHITKSGDQFFSTSMDYSKIPDDPLGYQPPRDEEHPVQSEGVQLLVRSLSAEEAEDALAPWLNGSDVLDFPDLFGEASSDSWTAAVMSDLKPMAADIRMGRLRRVLSTAMPLRDDFQLFLNGHEVESFRVEKDRVGTWVLGEELIDLPRPAPEDLEVRDDPAVDPNQPGHHGLSNGELGRVWGYVEVFSDPIDSGKSANLIGRSNGFFVYARGRLLNTEDPGFGIDRNLLRHGTFSRLRVVVHIDKLDDELRSSRESMREGEALTQARHLLHGLFNFARTKMNEEEETRDPTLQLAKRLAASPASLTERPIIRGVAEAMPTGTELRTVTYPTGLDDAEREAFLVGLIARAESDEGIIERVMLEDLSRSDSIAVLDVADGSLTINTNHPFVANFIDDFVDKKRNLPLELMAASEVLLEMNLLRSGLAPEAIDRLMGERDQLLREIARTRGRSNALTVANELLDAVNDKDALEEALVAAFESLGFHAVPKGGKDNPDGVAEAPLAPKLGVKQSYKVSLEAKSKERAGTRVSKDAVKVSTLARHRNENGCNWSVVVGQDFATTLGPDSAVMREISEDFENYDGECGVTLIRAVDLARLVRVAPVSRLTLSELQALFRECRHPDEAGAWIDSVAGRLVPSHQYREILETIWEEQRADETEAVTFGALRSALRRSKGLKLRDDELRQECHALMRMAPKHVYATDERVELDMRPDLVLEAISVYVMEAGE